MANQIVVSAGAKVRNLSGVLTATSGVVSFLPIDVSMGIPQLDVNGKILVSQLPNSVMEYKGTWSAATNTPTLANGTGNQGDVYLCNVAGTVDFGAGPIAFFVGDQVIYSGSIWQRASGAIGTVTSVAVTESGDSLNITGSPITTSGTINIGFNGTNLQYVNGAGNLTTFPILTGYVTAVSGTAPVVSSGGTTPAISMAAATSSVDGYLLATDFAIFNAKQSALTFSSPLVNTSGTISIPAATTSVNGYLASADFTTFNNKQNAITLTTTGTSGASTLVGATLNIPQYADQFVGTVTSVAATGGTGISITGSPITTSGTITITNTAPDQTVALTASTGISVTGTYPNFTITNTSPSSGGTVTSVAALTIGTTGTDLSSSVANSTTTPVITLNVPTASATNRGALSSADWTTFNNKQSALTNPVTGTGTTNYLPKFTGASTIGNSLVYDNGSGVGIGTTVINYNLQIGLTSDASSTINVISSTSGFNRLLFSDTNNGQGGLIYRHSTDTLSFIANDSERMHLNSTGNLGLGVTPSAWYTGYTALQVGFSGSIFSNRTSADTNITMIGNNAFLNSGATNWIYQNNGFATRYAQVSGGHEWHTAPNNTSGAGNAITFTQAMTLTAAGRLLLGTSTESTYLLDVNGTGRFSRNDAGNISLTIANAYINQGNLINFQHNTAGSTTNGYIGHGGDSTGNFVIINNSITALSFARATGAATFSSTLQVGASQAIITPTNFGYSSSYKVLALGTGASNTNISLNYDPSGNASASFNGTGQILIAHNKGILAPNAANNDFIAVLRPSDTGVYFGGGMSSGEVAGNGLFISTTGAATFSSSVTATGFFESSDSRLKTLIQDNYQTKGIASITPKLYTKNGKVELGYYAQDFVGILDSAVSKGSDDMLSLSYREVHTAKIYALEQEIKELKAKMN